MCKLKEVLKDIENIQGRLSAKLGVLIKNYLDGQEKTRNILDGVLLGLDLVRLTLEELDIDPPPPSAPLLWRSPTSSVRTLVCRRRLFTSSTGCVALTERGMRGARTPVRIFVRVSTWSGWSYTSAWSRSSRGSRTTYMGVRDE